MFNLTPSCFLAQSFLHAVHYLFNKQACVFKVRAVGVAARVEVHGKPVSVRFVLVVGGVFAPFGKYGVYGALTQIPAQILVVFIKQRGYIA